MMVNSLSCLANPKAEHPSQKTSAVGVESVTGHGIFSLPTDINMASISTGGVNSMSTGNDCDELEIIILEISMKGNIQGLSGSFPL